MGAAFRNNEPVPLSKRRNGAVTIRVVGVGGAGSNAVGRMLEDMIPGVEFIVANTDAQALLTSAAPLKLRLGESLTRGLGAGGDPSVGSRAAQESLEEARAMLRGSDLVFVTAGMGGGTGTGAAPVIAKLAHEIGAITIAVVTTPFRFEGIRRAHIASQGVNELRQFVDTLIVIPNERLISVVDNHMPFTEALKTGDDILRQGVRGVSDLITSPGLINLDFADVRSIISGAGSALMAIGEASGERRAMAATQRAVESALLESDIRGARRILLNIAGGSDLTLFEVNEIATAVQKLAHPDATIIFGASQNDNLNHLIRVTIVAAAFEQDALSSSGSVTRLREAYPQKPSFLPPQQRQQIHPPDVLQDQTARRRSTQLTEPLSSEEPTVALPALTPVIPAQSFGLSAAEKDISASHTQLLDNGSSGAEPDEQADDSSPEIRSIENEWRSPDTASDGAPPPDSLDIPAFLRRKPQ